MDAQLCKNCFLSIDDMRKSTRCDTCQSPIHKECAIKDGGTFCDLCYTVRDAEAGGVAFEMPEEIRRTYIELYKSCPHKFLKEVIEGNESSPTCYTQIGIDLHELFDQCSNRFFPKEDMLETWEHIWGLYDPNLFESKEQKEKMYQRAIDSINTFYVVLPTLPEKPYATEETIRFDVGEGLPRARFTMDRIDEIDGELEMLDWKTGKVMVGQKLSSDLQAPMYIYGVKKHYGKPVRKFTFYYLQENKERVFIRDEHDEDTYWCTVNKRKYRINLTDAIREIQHIFSQIKNGNFNIPRDTKKMHFTCKMCHLQKEGLCEGAYNESWKQMNGGGYTW